MTRLNRLFTALTTLSLCLSAQATTKTGEHERLRIRNDFKTPEEVVEYYCARDASGFVWSGLLDAERAAFTLWQQAPQQDSFYIAKKYEIHPVKTNSKDEAIVEVMYELSGIGDGNGSRVPKTGQDNQHRVRFDLRKVNGRWKIEKPSPNEIAPVVLESKFPFATSVADSAAR
jgi:hypothetical protein